MKSASIGTFLSNLANAISIERRDITFGGRGGNITTTSDNKLNQEILMNKTAREEMSKNT